MIYFSTVRFRWYQGKIPDTDFGPEWALDNVYIGMACPDHCNGHGTCFGIEYSFFSFSIAYLF